MIMTTMKTATNLFVCQYWDANACDPSRWSYEPSTYGVPGVQLVGTPNMRLWDDVSAWKNPGRYSGADLGKVEELKQDIQDNGICLDAPVVYYDVDTDENVNGDHRYQVSKQLDIPGWMMQGVRFDSLAAKVRFATKSNRKKKDVFNPISPADVESATRELLSIGAIITDDDIKQEVRSLGKGSISESAVKVIYNRIIAERLISGNSTGTERFQEWNEDKLPIFMDNTQDPWIDEVYKNTSEYSLYVNMKNFDSRIASIINAAMQATVANKPLNLLISVPILKNEKLDTTRKKVFTDRLAQLEHKICTILGMDSKRFGTMFPWHHPDAQHRFMPQDNNSEDPKLLVSI
jgi:hypothetical protein